MIKLINNILPYQTNQDIISMLISQAKWVLADDNGRHGDIRLTATFEKMLKQNVSNAGFAYVSYDRRFNIHLNTPLNLYADIIFYTIKNKFKKIASLERVYWNYYDSSSEPNLHKDELEKGYMSIIYNLHTNDGGTLIDKKFYPSKESQAIVFPSNIFHKGVSSQKMKHRFNLNMIVK